MLFSRQLPLSNLIDLCLALRHNLGAGLMLRDVFRQMARRGPVHVRPIAERIQDRGVISRSDRNCDKTVHKAPRL